ncbi:MAG TPA: hypothetical protein VMH37_17995 [Candidatus Binataceae bacterium]|nr:hypothetical protein [Candidatus Binataceae bacterium]
MTRNELIDREWERSKAYSRAFWIFWFVILGGSLAVMSPGDVWPPLGRFTGDSWLSPLLAGIYLLVVWNYSRMPRCPRCRGWLNGPVVIATDRCGRCGQIAVDDPREAAA